MRKLIWLIPVLLALLTVGLCLELTNAKGVPNANGKANLADWDEHPWDIHGAYRIDTLAITNEYLILRIWTSPDSFYVITVPRPTARGLTDYGKRTRSPLER